MLQLVCFNIYHSDCPACASTEKFPEIELSILQSQAHGNGKAEALQHAVFPDPDSGEKYLKYWKDSAIVTSYGGISRSKDFALFHVSLKSNSGWVTDAIKDNGGYFMENVTVINGVEKWRVLIDGGNKSDLFHQLEFIGTPNLESISQVTTQSLFNRHGVTGLVMLTERQRLVLSYAVKHGYFDEPRKSGSRELARELGMSQSTFLEHIRKAQYRLFSSIL
ncbi:MAG: helix-turn-helix domain-containing protein [Candidatus Thermoplasmatota archaeon]|jgi:predicted DNA binding protein|nr:helix-turn-helix domain-containing protein [Candidatus Thermoplasmatota archaeon]MCL5955046.1 helix-turn-helix domain-containing protein [Candidatus Thermoplasmatota archaeon]